MSTTTTTTSSTAAAVAGLASIPAIVGVFAGNKLAGINTTIQGDLATAETDAASALTELQTKLDAAETSNPLVAAALSSAKGTLTALGLSVPSESQLFTGLKAAANDLIGSLKTA